MEGQHEGAHRRRWREIAVPLIALAGTAAAGLALQHKEPQERRVSWASGNLSSAAGLVLADAVNAEAGIRSYTATGDPIFLAPYKLALTRIGAERRSFAGRCYHRR